ncbi:MAG: hypothetical protein HY360_27045, partial [Verrucomicrobia bacterium]|nr:hypothetical protein [Verrucomicrobiota bacterium]
ALMICVNEHDDYIPQNYPWDNSAPGGMYDNNTELAPDNYSKAYLGYLYHKNYLRSFSAVNCPSDPVRTTATVVGHTLPNNTASENYINWGHTCYGYCAGWGVGSPGLQYYWNDPPKRFNEFRNPAQTYWVADSSDLNWPAGSVGANFNYEIQNISSRHKGGLNILWLDGHVSWLSKQQAWYHHANNSGDQSQYWWDID